MKKIFCLLSCFLVLACIAIGSFAFSACEEQAKYSCEPYENIVYGEHERQTLDIYLPNERSGTVGLILNIHGGGWSGGSKSDCKNARKWCETYGYVVAAINYHYISAEFSCDDIMQDVALSLEKIKEFAANKGINIEKALLTGSSAGGHLSLFYAYKYADAAAIKPVAVASYAGPTDLTDSNYYVNNDNAVGYLDLFSKLCHTTFLADDYLNPDNQEKLLSYSPVNYVSATAVPTLICHGKKDDVVPYSNATILKQKLDLYGVKNDFVSYENSGHSLGQDKQQSKQAKKLFAWYAETYLV